MSAHKKILCLDFDGTIHSYVSGWKGARNIPDPPVDGAIPFLLESSKQFNVAIHSSRSRYWGGRRAMKAWLRCHIEDYLFGYPVSARKNPFFTSADANTWRTRGDVKIAARMFVQLRLSFPLWKPPAHVTIDDRAITFNGAWPTLAEIAEFRPWNRRQV